MGVVVIGGSGLIGSKLVTKFLEHGHDVIAPSRGPGGVNTITGEGLPSPPATPRSVRPTSRTG